MKKSLLIIILLNFLCHSAFASTVFHKDIILTSPDAIWTDSRTYSTLQGALDAIGASERDLYIAKSEVVTSMTINSNIRLHFLKDGAINNSGQLTINTKDITAGDQQIFTGSGDIDFATGSTVRSTWFSSLPTAITITSDDTLTLIISTQSNIDADCAVGDNVQLRWNSPNLITVNAGRVLSNVKSISAGDFQLFTGSGDIDFLDGTVLNLNWFERLRSVITWIETENITLEIRSSSQVTFDNTIPTNIGLKFYRGGNFTTDAGKTITFNTKSLGSHKHPTFLGSGSYTFASGTDLQSAWFADFETAITKIGSDDVELTLTDAISIANDCSLNANTTLKVPSKGRSITIANTKTLTINSKFNPDPYQMFFGLGDVVFGNNAKTINTAYSEWFGAVGDGVTNDYSEIQKALDLGTLQFSLVKGKTYISESTLSTSSNQTINLNQATLKGGGDNDVLDLSGKHHVIVKDGTLDGDILGRTSIYGIHGIKGIAAHDCEISYISFVGCGAGPGCTKESGLFVTFEANDDPLYSVSSSTGPSYNNSVHDCIFNDEFVSFGVRYRTQWDSLLTSSECYNNHAFRNKFISIGKSAIEIAGHKTHSCSATYNYIEASKIDGIDIDKGACYCTVAFNTIKSVADGLDGTSQWGGVSVCSIWNSTNGNMIALGNKVANNTIQSARRVGIRIGGARETQVSNNNIGEFGTYGIFFDYDGTGNIYPKDNDVSSTIITGPAGYFDGGLVLSTPTVILMRYSEGVNLTSVRIKDSPYRAIHIANSNTIDIHDAVIDTTPNSTSSYPIYLNSVYKINLSSCNITQSGTFNTDGLIRALDADHINIIGSRLYVNGVTDFAIRMTGTSYDVMAVGNEFSNYGSVHPFYSTYSHAFVADNLPCTQLIIPSSSSISKTIRSAEINSMSGVVTASLGDGYYIGQIKTIVMINATNSSTCIVDHHETSDPEVGTFDAVDEVWSLEWTGTEWITLFATCTF